MFWLALMTLCLALAVGGALYVMFHARRFGFIKRIYEKNKIAGCLISLFPIGLCMLFTLVNIFAAIVAILHLVLIWMLCDLIALIIRKCSGRARGRYLSGAAAMAVTAIYLACGWYLAHHVFETDYELKTQKSLGRESLRIVMFADLHVGVTLDGEAFAEQCRRMEELSPDIVVVCGDYVDDDSSLADLERASEALGSIKTTYGVYYSYGNHDRGYYSNRDYTAEDLVRVLESNNVKILQDSYAEFANVVLIGREDKQRERKEASALTEGIDHSKYIIMLDHQPNDYDAEAASGADLVLSGHTHGGHVFPAGPIGKLLGANDRIYGMEERGDTTFIVTSGISGWAIPFKTGTASEFVVIDVTGK